MKKLLYENEQRSNTSNIRWNHQLGGAMLLISQDLNPLCDEICSINMPNLQMEPILDTYNGEGDPIAHIKAFDIKFKLKFGMNDNLMVKYLPTIFWGDVLNWYFSLLAKYINCYAQIILEFYIHFKYYASRQMTLFDLVSSIQDPNERFDRFFQRFQKIWIMIPKPLYENHIISIFIHNINPKIRFQAL